MSPGSVNMIMRRVTKIIYLACLPLFALVAGWQPAAAEEPVETPIAVGTGHHRRS